METLDKYIHELEQLKIFMNNKIDLICSNEEYYGIGSLSKYWLPKFNEKNEFGKQKYVQTRNIKIKPAHGIPIVNLEIKYKYAEYLCTRFNSETTIKIIN